MNNVRQLPQKIQSLDLSWMIPAGFGLSCALLAASVILLFVRGTSGMENIWMFSIGADVFCLAVCVMLSFSCVLNYKNRNDHTRVFVTLLTVNAAALFFYNSQSGYRNIARELKYNFRIAQGRVFARRLGEALAGAEHFADVDAVVPVPLHWTRRWKRGYNQAEIIAREVAAALGAPLRTDILSKPRRRSSQVRSNAQARGANISGAFKANVPEGIRHILLVDDTFTTGSTLAACHAALRECVPGDVRISAATLAFVRNR